ncbi:MAG: hypothetical protein QOJ03_2262 [Frankiaceae bacterium]|jgi:hypothetical protein|nr:hypothetical protein [Frankiaceae bacterium]
MTEPAELAGDLRHEEAISLGERNGWHHTHEEHSLAERWPGAPFGHGSWPKIHNVMRAQVGERTGILAFDYRYCVFSETDADVSDRYMLHRYLVVVIPLAAPVPALSASEGHYSHWRPKGERVPVQHERFGEHYDVVGDDPDFAAAVLEPEWMTRVLKRMRRTEWRLEGPELIAWARDQHVGHDLEALLEVLVPLADAADRAALSSR